MSLLRQDTYVATIQTSGVQSDAGRVQRCDVLKHLYCSENKKNDLVKI